MDHDVPITFSALLALAGVFVFINAAASACFAVLAVGVAHIDALWVESDAIWEAV